MNSLFIDLAYAARNLRKNPGFSLTAILSLTCGIAATTAVFSVVWGVLMNPYPYAAPDRMAHLAMSTPTSRGYDQMLTTASQWQEIRKVPAIEDAVLTNSQSITITGGDLPEDLRAGYMSSNGFNFFGVPAVLGRGFQPSDAVDGHDPQPVTVLSYKLWRRRFDSDPKIVGRTIELAHQPYTVIGVAAQRFTWNDADLYLPMKITQSTDPYTAEVRLRPGVTHAMAEQQLTPLVQQFEKDTPNYFPPKPGPLHVIGLNDMFVKAIGPALAMLFGAVALLLAIACGNVSILLLARATVRAHEFAIRAAIGASRSRLVRQLLTESLLLSVTGAGLGVLVAYKLLAVIVALLPENAFPHEAALTINLPVLIFSVVVALLTGVVFGLFPALRLSRPDIREAMGSGTRKVAGSVSGRTASNALIAAQIALSLLMLATASAAIQSFLKMLSIPLGYDPHNVMSVGIPIHSKAEDNIQSRSARIEQLRAKIASTPGVREAAISTNATPPSNGFRVPVTFLGIPASEEQQVGINLVGENYFSLLQIPLRQGRLWSADEARNAARICVVNSALAGKYFPNGDAIGHSLRTAVFKPQPPQVVVSGAASEWLQIVGITEDKLDDGVGKPVLPEAFVPYTLAMGPYTQILVRSDGPPLALLHSIGLSVASIDRDQQIGGQTRDLEHWISTQPEYADGQLISSLFGAFAALALLLAAVGLYSVVSYTVAQRTNEFGIRMALGALRGHVIGLVLRSTAVPVGCGVAGGIALTLVLRQVLQHLASASPIDGLAMATAVGVLAAVAFAASGIPARRAARVDPMEALRYE
jgi:putative ABC transport system permease protein